MGSILYPIAVDLKKVRGALGSKKKALLTKLWKARGNSLDQIDDMLEDQIQDEEDAEPLTTADVLRHMIMGEEYREEFGFAYGYVFETLCLHFGDLLDNSMWSAMRAEWFESVQRALAQAGVSKKQFNVDLLCFRGPPVEIPGLEEFPCIGYLTKTEVVKARAVLAKADLSKVKIRNAAASIEQIRSWLDECAKSKRDLVCTYT